MVEDCRRDQDLQGISFEVMDLFNLDRFEQFDIVIANAVFYSFSKDEFCMAIRNK